MDTRSLKSACPAIASIVLGICLAGPLLAQAFGSAHWRSRAKLEGGPQGSMTIESELWMKDKKVRITVERMTSGFRL